MAIPVRSKILYALELIAMFVAILFILGKEYRSTSADSASANRAQIYVSVKDDAAKPVPNASVQLVGGDSKITNEAGLARLNVGRNGVGRVRVSASGFKEAELSVQGSSIDPNKLIVLSPTSKEPSASDNRGSSSPVEPYVETVRSGPEESGLGSDFSPWYRLDSPVAKMGYVVDSWDYALSGDRRCNEWSECRVTNSDNQVVFSFRMQGHSEWLPPHPGLSEGVLRVQYKPISRLSDSELKKAILEFSARAGSTYGRFYDLEDRITQTRKGLATTPPTDQQAIAQFQRALEENTRDLTGMFNTLARTDAPLANLYRAELIRRLESQEGKLIEFPTFPASPDSRSLNTFLNLTRPFYDLARRLRE